jgi:hypothetical protein
VTAIGECYTVYIVLWRCDCHVVYILLEELWGPVRVNKPNCYCWSIVTVWIYYCHVYICVHQKVLHGVDTHEERRNSALPRKLRKTTQATITVTLFRCWLSYTDREIPAPPWINSEYVVSIDGLHSMKNTRSHSFSVVLWTDLSSRHLHTREYRSRIYNDIIWPQMKVFRFRWVIKLKDGFISAAWQGVSLP